MLCVRSERRKLAVCSVHLTNKSTKAPGQQRRKDVRRDEARQAMEIIASAYRGYTVFVGGDLNDTPLSGTDDNFYDPGYRRGAHGRFKEVDSPCGNAIRERHRGVYCRGGERTAATSKIDYLFVPPAVRVNWADVTDARHSDHRLLWAGVTF